LDVFFAATMKGLCFEGTVNISYIMSKTVQIYF
jgi:hypothetical protein